MAQILYTNKQETYPRKTRHAIHKRQKTWHKINKDESNLRRGYFLCSMWE